MKITFALAMLVAASAAQAQTQVRVEQADVVSVTPIVEAIVVGRQCYQTQVPVARERSYGGAVIGGIAGGLLGSLVGGGSGRQVAIATGAVVGALTGDNIDNSQRYPGYVNAPACTYVTQPKQTGSTYVAQTGDGTQVSGYTSLPIYVGQKVQVQVMTTVRIAE